MKRETDGPCLYTCAKYMYLINVVVYIDRQPDRDTNVTGYAQFQEKPGSLQ